MYTEIVIWPQKQNAVCGNMEELIGCCVTSSLCDFK